MRLSDNFTLAELCKSATANRLGIDNTPNVHEIDKLRRLAIQVLQPIRDEFGPVKVNSGYRCLELNRAIGSKDTSQHTKGEAADIEVVGLSNWELAFWIKENLVYDQLLLEFCWSHDDYISGNDVIDLNKGWCHISRVLGEDNRNEILQINSEGVFEGLGRKRTRRDEWFNERN